MFKKIKIGKTIFNGIKRALKVNVAEVTTDDDINDALAKAVKIITRAAILIVLYKLFPGSFEELFNLIAQG